MIYYFITIPRDAVTLAVIGACTVFLAVMAVRRG